jgi:putative tryptophan/tyrosine transport system substrate-binding protein
MRRREFIALLGGAAAWPLAARAQQPAMPVIGFLNQGSAKARVGFLVAFRQGLDEYGYVEGRNVAVEYRWADDERDRLSELAADLVHRQVAVIFAGAGLSAARAAKAATSTIPIVLVTGFDLVQNGIVGSLNRPGGNITGVTLLDTALMAKRLDLLRELVPQATTVAYLSPEQTGLDEDMLREMLAAARMLGRQLVIAEARSESDFEPAFATFVERGAGALVVGSSVLFNSNRDKLVALAARHRIPAIYTFRMYPSNGGLISYGTSVEDAFRLAGRYVGQILQGAKPADMPVQQSSRFDLVINLKTAKALGLEVPPTLLGRADEVIE